MSPNNAVPIPVSTVEIPIDSMKKKLISLGLDPFAAYLDLTALDYLSVADLTALSGHSSEPDLLFILMNLFAAVNSGSVCLHLVPETLLADFPMELKEAGRHLIRSFLLDLGAGKYHRLISSDPNRFVPLIWVEAPVPRLYFQKYYTSESGLIIRLKDFWARREDKDLTAETIDGIVDTLYSVQGTIRISGSGTPIARDSIQEKALKLGLRLPLTIISGGPGTGKTSLMVNLLRGFLRCGVDAGEIILGAPTGRAAQRMTEAIQTQMATIREPTPFDTAVLQLKGATIHRILKYDPKRHQFYYHANRRLPARVVIVDEVSMVDLVMMDHLLQSLEPQRTQLIFLGDKNQLPSVEAGSVLADLIPSTQENHPLKENLVVLKTVFRSGRELTRLAEKINTGRLPPPVFSDFAAALNPAAEGWQFVTVEDEEQLAPLLHSWTHRIYLTPSVPGGKSFIELVREASRYSTSELEKTDHGTALLADIWSASERARILTLARIGPLGCEAMNERLARMIVQASRGRSHYRSNFRAGLFPGALVIVRRNDYAKELFNGDMGVVLMDNQGTIKVYFQKANLFFGCPPDMLPPYELAFALTVHQSQGSEYRHILLVLPDDVTHRLLTREMLYTAVTRAKRQIIILGRWEVLAQAANRRINRQTGMLEILD